MDKEELFAMMETYANASDNEYCVIDPATREISVSPGYQIIGVESDQKVERIRFQCPKIVGDNIDLSQLSISINYRNANGEVDQNLTENLQTEGDNITFDWVLTRKVTAYKGTVSFIVCAVKASEDGTITNEWNTTLASVEVLEGIEAALTQEEEEQARDVLTQLLDEMEVYKDEKLHQIEQKGQETLASIPEDYTQLQADVQAVMDQVNSFTFALNPVDKGLDVTYTYDTETE